MVRISTPHSSMSPDIENTVGLLTIKRPGAMDKREVKQIVVWLRRIADGLEMDTSAYTRTGKFTARFIPVPKKLR